MPIHIANRRRTTASLNAAFPGAEIIDVTSNGPDPWVRLSPFFPHGGIPAPGGDDHRDVADPTSPLSHAALIRLHLEGRWPAEG